MPADRRLRAAVLSLATAGGALLSPAAMAGSCTWVGFRDVVDVPAPAVIVLGERHGTQPDLNRAAKVVRKLARQAPVSVALEAVHHRFQPILDRYAQDKVEAGDLPALLDWDDSWGFAWRPYAALVTASDLDGVGVIAAGLDLGKKPEEAEIPIPPRYMDLLRPAMGDHPMPASMEPRFVQSMAWRDHEIARRGVEGWDGSGYLVIVTGRGHVEGSKGVGWQAALQTQAPVHAFVLKAGKEPPCYAGDRLWK